MNRKFILVHATLLAMVSLTLNSSYAQCETFIENKSNTAWSFSFIPAPQQNAFTDDNVYINNSKDLLPCVLPATCTVLPHSKVTLVYNSDKSKYPPLGIMSIQSQDNSVQYYNYGQKINYSSSLFYGLINDIYTYVFDYLIDYSYYDSHSCPYLSHHQGTGAVSLNQPSYGAIVIEQDHW